MSTGKIILTKAMEKKLRKQKGIDSEDLDSLGELGTDFDPEATKRNKQRKRKA